VIVNGEAGETVIPRGKPLTVTLAEPVKPFSGVRERVSGGVVPPTSAAVDGAETEMLKSCTGGGMPPPPPPPQPIRRKVSGRKRKSRVRLSNFA